MENSSKFKFTKKAAYQALRNSWVLKVKCLFSINLQKRKSDVMNHLHPLKDLLL